MERRIDKCFWLELKKPWSLKDYRLIILPVACPPSFLCGSERESLKPVPSACSLYSSCTGFQYLNDKTRLQHLALQHRSKLFNIEVTFCPIYYSLVYIHNVTRSSHVIIKCKSKSNNEGRSKRGYFFEYRYMVINKKANGLKMVSLQC